MCLIKKQKKAFFFSEKISARKLTEVTNSEKKFCSFEGDVILLVYSSYRHYSLTLRHVELA